MKRIRIMHATELYAYPHEVFRLLLKCIACHKGSNKTRVSCGLHIRLSASTGKQKLIFKLSVKLEGHYNVKRKKNSGLENQRSYLPHPEASNTNPRNTGVASLEREPDDAYGFDEEERVRNIWHFVFLYFGAVGGGVEHLVVLEFGQRLQTEDHDGQQDHEHRDDGHHARRLRTLRVLEQQPHFALPLVRRQRLFLFLDEAFILPAKTTNHHPPELVDGVFPQLVELDLLREDVERDVDRPPQPPATLVVIQDGVEAGAVPIEEVLVPERVKVPDPPGRVAQQRVRELVQRPKLSLEPQTTHLKYQNSNRFLPQSLVKCYEMTFLVYTKMQLDTEIVRYRVSPGDCWNCTYVNDDPLTEVVVVRNRLEVLHTGELALIGRPVLVPAAEFGQRPLIISRMHTAPVSAASTPSRVSSIPRIVMKPVSYHDPIIKSNPWSHLGLFSLYGVVPRGSEADIIIVKC
ncbi:hypothetical protein C0J52_24831 [Blattella germanica]|nr:hypothetical protein C0J52_24831 [Blattella germanica]